MKISQIISEMATCAGSVASVAKPLGEVEKRPQVAGLKPVSTKAKKKGPYANSLSEGAVKQLSMDLKGGKDGLTDEEFKKKYGKTKAEVRKDMQNKPQKQEKPVQEARLEEEDKIIAVGKGHKLKTGLHGKDEGPKFRGFAPPFKSEGMHVSDKRGNSVCECGDHLMAPIVAKALNAYAIANESIDIEGAGALAGGLQYEGEGEGETFKNSLHTVIRVARHLDKELHDGADLPEWVSEKMGAAKGMIVAVMDYIISEKERNVERRTGRESVTSEGAKVDRMVKHIEKSERKLGHSKKEAENIAWATANKRGMLDNKNKKKGK